MAEWRDGVAVIRGVAPAAGVAPAVVLNAMIPERSANHELGLLNSSALLRELLILAPDVRWMVPHVRTPVNQQQQQQQQSSPARWNSWKTMRCRTGDFCAPYVVYAVRTEGQVLFRWMPPSARDPGAATNRYHMTAHAPPSTRGAHEELVRGGDVVLVKRDVVHTVSGSQGALVVLCAMSRCQTNARYMGRLAAKLLRQPTAALFEPDMEQARHLMGFASIVHQAPDGPVVPTCGHCLVR